DRGAISKRSGSTRRCPCMPPLARVRPRRTPRAAAAPAEACPGARIGATMNDRTYYVPQGGHPPQSDLLSGRAVFTEAYAVIPRGVLRDIVTSALPFWDKTRVWILSRPLSGFAETFSNYVVEVGPGGGSDKPEPDGSAEAVLFVVGGEALLTLSGREHRMKA